VWRASPHFFAPSVRSDQQDLQSRVSSERQNGRVERGGEAQVFAQDDGHHVSLRHSGQPVKDGSDECERSQELYCVTSSLLHAAI